MPRGLRGSGMARGLSALTSSFVPGNLTNLSAPYSEGDALMPVASRVHNRRTVAGYERCARDYAASVSSAPSPSGAEALRQLASAVAPGGRVLEIGSGPGWDADFLETLGIDVHRTDAAAAFCDFQAERGKRCDPLDLLAD